LARRLAAKALAGPLPSRGLIVDPACGGGALLAAAVEKLGETHSAVEVAHLVSSRFRGTDLDRHAVRLCELAVRVALLPLWASVPERKRPSVPQLAFVRDGLDDEDPAAVVLSNPPFGRVRLTSEERARYSDVLYGHAHLPTLFLHSAVQRLVPSGVAAFVVPASVVGGAYYQNLRAYLTREAPPEWIAFVDQREGIFTGGVLQETLLASFVRGRMVGDVEVERIPPEGDPQVFSARAWRRTHSWLIPRAADEVELVERAMQRELRLEDYGWRVSTGPLVWNRHKDQLSDTPAPHHLPVVWASDIRDGVVDPTTTRTNRFVAVEPGQHWLVLDKPAVLIQRTTAPEQPRRLVAGLLDSNMLARLGGRVVVENHVNVCTCSENGLLTPERLVEYLASDEADRLYRCATGSVAVSAFELRQLPLPDPDELNRPLQQAVRAA
jgi:adenine-specific DNA-methyltransferase